MPEYIKRSDRSSKRSSRRAKDAEQSAYQPSSSRAPIVSPPYLETEPPCAELGYHFTTKELGKEDEYCCLPYEAAVEMEKPNKYQERSSSGREHQMATPSSRRGRSSKSKRSEQEYRERSVGGREYRRRSPSPDRPGSTRKKNRDRYGFSNPSHGHENMLPILAGAALPPPPREFNEEQIRKYVLNPEQCFRGTSPGRSRTIDFQDHKNGVLGHDIGASEYFNTVGHKKSKKKNKERNDLTSTYHGFEYRPWSDASGGSAPRYIEPSPGIGSHRSYWDKNHPKYEKGMAPWYELVESEEGSHHRDRSASPKTKTKHTRERSSHKSRSRRQPEIVDPPSDRRQQFPSAYDRRW